MHTRSYWAHSSAVYTASNKLKMTHYFNEILYDNDGPERRTNNH